MRKKQLKKENLSLANLISEITDLLNNSTAEVRSNNLIHVLIDIENIIEYSDNSFTLYWGFRSNGTYLAETKSELIAWKDAFKNKIEGEYSISFDKEINKYSISSFSK